MDATDGVRTEKTDMNGQLYMALNGVCANKTGYKPDSEIQESKEPLDDTETEPLQIISDDLIHLYDNFSWCLINEEVVCTEPFESPTTFDDDNIYIINTSKLLLDEVHSISCSHVNLPSLHPRS